MHRTTAFFASTLSTCALAQSLFVSQPDVGYDGRYGSEQWSRTSSRIEAHFKAVAAGGELSDLNELLTYDRLWLDQRLGSALSGAEMSNLLAFVETGRRVVIIGENPDWADWNESFVGALGGRIAGRYNGITHPVGTHELTAGVWAVTAVGASVSEGGWQLFEKDFASVWGPHKNVLTILDSNLFDDDHLVAFDNDRFTHNVIDWLVAPSPPGSALLVASGLALVRRRR